MKCRPRKFSFIFQVCKLVFNEFSEKPCSHLFSVDRRKERKLESLSVEFLHSRLKAK